ncbi:MAG: Flp pilus assembly complex ATPase component TadA [Clostridiales bacterium]|nr:Flp pilus assembly complex ATPase component TadA [Clostridiales bacterium]
MKELYKLIPDRYADIISSRLNRSKISEVRIRNTLPVRVCYGGVYYYLSANGISTDKQYALIAGEKEAEGVILRACEHSLYTIAETLKRGYIPVGGGIRVGVCGSNVLSGERTVSVKDFYAVNIRIPHEVINCAASLYYAVVANGGIKNTLIISPPGCGKTTVLRDLCRLISDSGRNVLLCDEKYELASCADGAPTLDVGCNTDVVSGADKPHALSLGIAYMRPDVIMTDELFPEDTDAVLQAIHSGISVISTVHARDCRDFTEKPEFERLVSSRAFSVFAVLDRTMSLKVYTGLEAA